MCATQCKTHSFTFILFLQVVFEMADEIGMVPGISRVMYDLTSKPPGKVLCSNLDLMKMLSKVSCKSTVTNYSNLQQIQNHVSHNL